MVVDWHFYQYFFLYGFCSACGVLKCSPVWCICGKKELSTGWTSQNELLDKFIKDSQIRTRTPNEPYLEWIPFEFFRLRGNLYSLDSVVHDAHYPFCGLPSCDELWINFIDISNETIQQLQDQVKYLENYFDKIKIVVC